MEKNRQLIGLVLLWVVSFASQAQTNRYMVFFTDKDNVPQRLDQPETYLSQRSIARREKSGISITEQDLPIDSAYLDGLLAAGAEVYFASRWLNGCLVQTSPSVITSISSLPYVASVVYLAPGQRLSRVQSSYEVPDQFEMPTDISASSETQLALLGVDQMHEDGWRGEGMLIAVFDNGFKGVNQYRPFEHLFDEGRLVSTKDFVKNSGNVFAEYDHGTRVLSCIAADYEDMLGTAPKASYLLCVTEDNATEYRIEEYNWLLAAEFADSAGADVINGSLGYYSFDDASMDYSYSEMDGQTAIVSQAAKMASERGMIVVVSAGNQGNSSTWPYVTSPADADNILAVGSVAASGSRSSFSSVGPTADGRIKPDVMAMGSFTAIVTQSGAITTGGGTSFASPQVAGFAAGIWQANPDWSHQEVMDAIRFSSSNALNPDSLRGYGVPNYALAVEGALLSVQDILTDKLTVYPNPFRENRISIDFGGLDWKGEIEISVLDARGALIYQQNLNAGKWPERIQIDLNTTEPGAYFLLLETEKHTKTVKLLKI